MAAHETCSPAIVQWRCFSCSERTGQGRRSLDLVVRLGPVVERLLAQGALSRCLDVGAAPSRVTKPRSATRQPSTAPRTGRWIQLTIVREDKLWPELCKALESVDLLERPAFPDDRKPARPCQRAGGDPRSGVRRPPLARMAQSACAITRSPSACSASCVTCRTIIRPSPTARWSKTHVPDMPRTISAPIRLSFAPEASDARSGPPRSDSTPASCWRSWVMVRTKSIRLRAAGALG